MNWINVKDRLPEEKVIVLVYADFNSFEGDQDGEDMCWGFLLDSVWRDLDNVIQLQVTHWQPLPEPPKQNLGTDMPKLIDMEKEFPMRLQSDPPEEE